MIDNGQNVKSINFFVGKSYIKKEHDSNDIDYWEESFPLLKTYNGYKFLYSETSVYLKSDWVEPDNIFPEVNWQELAKFGFETFIDAFVGEAVKAVKGFAASLSDFFDCFGNPGITKGVRLEIFPYSILTNDEE